MRTVLLLLAGMLALCWVSDADAQRRVIRVDGFGAWDIYEEPDQAACPGWISGSTLLFGPEGYVFSGRDDPSHLTNTYCQVPTPGNLTASEVGAQEPNLAAMVGDNPGDRVTAIRYSLLDGDQFDFENPPTGFQWMFFYFVQGGTIVGLYGLESTTLDDRSYIAQNGVRYWDAARDGYEGEYFCFEGLHYVGTWDGQLPSGSPCVTIGFRVFRGDFE